MLIFLEGIRDIILFIKSDVKLFTNINHKKLQ